MLTNLKALVVVLTVSWLVFALAKPLVLRFEEGEAFQRRRNIWLLLTAMGFISPSIWLYAIVAMPLMYWGAKKDTNPLALYVLLAWVIPKTDVRIPTIGIGQLIDINYPRMMAMAILVPIIFRSTQVMGVAPGRRFTVMDWLLAAFGILQLILVLPYDSPTNTLRRAVLYFLDTFIMFYAFARIAPAPKVIKEVLVNLVLAIAIMGAIGAFESLRGWLLYGGIAPMWGANVPAFTSYLMRDNMLRAQAASGHSLVLGYLTAIALGLWLYLSRSEKKIIRKYSMFAVLVCGCIVAGSRGAWLTAVIFFIIYAVLRPDAWRFIAKAIPVTVVALVVILASPLRQTIIDKLPFIGTSDQDTVAYRQQVAEVSWRLIREHPFLGDPFALRYMEELRQGQGIIDIMNGYANVALFTGGIGFSLFVSLFVIVLWRCFFKMLNLRLVDSDAPILGASLIACLLASLFFVATAAIDPPTYWICGIMAGYSGLAVQGKNAARLAVVVSGSRDRASGSPMRSQS